MSAPDGTIVIHCPNCKSNLSFAPHQAGQSGPCAYCGHVVTVPNVAASVPVNFAVSVPSSPNPAAGAAPETGGLSAGRFVGALLIVLGGILWGINIGLLSSSGYTFKILLAGPALALWGVSLLIFPGKHVPFAAWKDLPQNERNRWMREAPTLHKIVWVVAGILGIVVGIGSLF